MATQLERARPRIIQYFEDSRVRVFTARDLGRILSSNRAYWHLAQSTSAQEFIDFLLATGNLSACTLSCEDYENLVRYLWREVSPFELGLALWARSYLSHGTALFLHGLTEQVPRTIYVNKEQAAKRRPTTTELSQAGINRAFANRQRSSRYVFRFDGWRVVRINGKQTGRLEVGELQGPQGEALEVTKIERTLIDAAVRPAYSGGVTEVGEAYRTAKGRVSTRVLLATLKKLSYAYPYHQAIGFYLQRAGYPEEVLGRFSDLGIDHDFHLAHGVAESERKYSSRWRLFYPKDL